MQSSSARRSAPHCYLFKLHDRNAVFAEPVRKRYVCRTSNRCGHFARNFGQNTAASRTGSRRIFVRMEALYGKTEHTAYRNVCGSVRYARRTDGVQAGNTEKARLA